MQHLSMEIKVIICTEEKGVWGKRSPGIEICEARSCEWDRFSGIFKINIAESEDCKLILKLATSSSSLLQVIFKARKLLLNKIKYLAKRSVSLYKTSEIHKKCAWLYCQKLLWESIYPTACSLSVQLLLESTAQLLPSERAGTAQGLPSLGPQQLWSLFCFLFLLGFSPNSAERIAKF